LLADERKKNENDVLYRLRHHSIALV